MAVAVLTRALSSAKRNGALQAAPIAAVALGTAAPLVPAVGDTVTARVLRTQQRLCSVEVLCVGDQKLKSAFLGVIRLQDVRDFAGEQVPIPAPAFYWGVLRLLYAPFPAPAFYWGVLRLRHAPFPTRPALRPALRGHQAASPASMRAVTQCAAGCWPFLTRRMRSGG